MAGCSHAAHRGPTGKPVVMPKKPLRRPIADRYRPYGKEGTALIWPSPAGPGPNQKRAREEHHQVADDEQQEEKRRPSGRRRPCRSASPAGRREANTAQIRREGRGLVSARPGRPYALRGRALPTPTAVATPSSSSGSDVARWLTPGTGSSATRRLPAGQRNLPSAPAPMGATCGESPGNLLALAPDGGMGEEVEWAGSCGLPLLGMMVLRHGSAFSKAGQGDVDDADAGAGSRLPGAGAPRCARGGGSQDARCRTLAVAFDFRRSRDGRRSGARGRRAEGPGRLRQRPWQAVEVGGGHDRGDGVPRTRQRGAGCPRSRPPYGDPSSGGRGRLACGLMSTPVTRQPSRCWAETCAPPPQPELEAEPVMTRGRGRRAPAGVGGAGEGLAPSSWWRRRRTSRRTRHSVSSWSHLSRGRGSVPASATSSPAPGAGKCVM